MALLNMDRGRMYKQFPRPSSSIRVIPSQRKPGDLSRAAAVSEVLATVDKNKGAALIPLSHARVVPPNQGQEEAAQGSPTLPPE